MGYKATPRGERARLLGHLEQHPEKVTSQLLLKVTQDLNNPETFENPELVDMLKELDEYAAKLEQKRKQH